MREEMQLSENGHQKVENSDGREQDRADAQFGLDLMADGAWKVMLGLEVLRDHPELFGQTEEELANTEYFIRQLNQELDKLYDLLPDSLDENS